MKILIVDDELDILEFLKYNFEKEGYEVFTASNGVKAISKAQKHIPNLIILDVMMPKMDGLETCRELRKISSLNDTKIIFLTARNEDITEIAGFDAGADDFVAKPLRPKALMARVKSLLKKVGGKNDKKAIRHFGELSINLDNRTVIVNNSKVKLPKKEYNLLVFLSSQPEKVFSREDIYSTIWGDGIIVGDRTIDVHIRNLRKLIGKKYIKTYKGFGYSFCIEHVS